MALPIGGGRAPTGPLIRSPELVDAERLQLEMHYQQLLTAHPDLHEEAMNVDGELHGEYESLIRSWASIVVRTKSPNPQIPHPSL